MMDHCSLNIGKHIQYIHMESQIKNSHTHTVVHTFLPTHHLSNCTGKHLAALDFFFKLSTAQIKNRNEMEVYKHVITTVLSALENTMYYVEKKKACKILC